MVNLSVLFSLLLLLLLLLFYYYYYYYYCNNNKNTLKNERKSNASGKNKLFSVFCHCSVLRTLSLVINIIIIITIIKLLFLYLVRVCGERPNERQHVASLNCH